MSPTEEAVIARFRKLQKEIALKYDKAAARRTVEYRILRRLLRRVGTLYRTSGGELFFFRLADHQLYDVEGERFKRYLIQLTGQAAFVMKQWLEKLQAHAAFRAAEVEPHFVAYNAPDLEVIAVTTFDGCMLMRRRGGRWERHPNGQNGILFRNPPDFVTPWTLDATAGTGESDLTWLVSLAHLDEDGPLSAADQRWLMRVWFVHLFLPGINPVHPIPLHEGLTGTGKTTFGELLGRVLTGGQFEVTDLPSGDAAKAEESLKLALSKRPIVVIDNVDSPTPWFEDFACRVATGVRMSRRKLYKDSDEVHFTPKAGLILTSRDPHFRREDVARRLLPLRFGPIPDADRRTETDLRREVDARRHRILTEVLAIVARVQDAWPTLRAQLKPSHSLADFSLCGAAVSHVLGHGVEAWRALMGRLERAQGRFTVEDDPLGDLLEAFLAQGTGTLPMQPVRELYQELHDLAAVQGIPWPWKHPGAFTKALKNKRLALQQRLPVKITLSNNHQGGEYWVGITRPTAAPSPSHSNEGGDGGDGGDDEPDFLVEVPAVSLGSK